MKKIGYTKDVDTSFTETVDNITLTLKEQGFGVLTKIDMKSKLKEKLGKDIEEYMILGACNPGLANEALEAEYEIGLLLPCNVIVYEKQGKVYASTILPTIAMGDMNNATIQGVAEKAETKLKLAIDNL